MTGCTDHLTVLALFTWMIMHYLIMYWAVAIMHWISYTDHVPDHELIMWLIMH